MALSANDLLLRVGVDVSNLQSGMRTANEAVDSLGTHMETTRGKGESFFSGITGGFAKIGMAAIGVKALASGVSALATGMVQGNADMETYITQFSVLLGGMDQAKGRMAELAKFAAVTPFNLPEIVRADKLLQTFGGTVLATGQNLTMVGDMAAASGGSYEEVATWVGRAYDAMQSGRPFGEAAQRLQELGLMSGGARAQLEEMQKSGKSGAEMWGVFTASMGKYAGMMEQQASTFSGMMSTVQDDLGALQRTAFEPLFMALKDGLKGVMGFLESPATMGAIQNFALGFKGAIEAVVNGVSGLASRVVPVFQVIASYVTGTLIPAISALAGIFMTVFGAAIGFVVSLWRNTLQPALMVVAGIFSNILIPAVLAIAGAIASVLVPVFTFLSQHTTELTIALGAVGVVILVGLVPAFAAWAVAAGAAAIATIASMLPIIAVFAVVFGAVMLLKAAWENNFMGIREITKNVGDAIGGILQWIGDKFKWLGDTLGTVFSWIGDLFKGFQKTAETAGANTGTGYTTYMTNSIYSGLPGVGTQVGNAANTMSSLYDPAGKAGGAIGSNYIQSMADGAWSAMPALDEAAKAAVADLMAVQDAYVKLTITQTALDTYSAANKAGHGNIAGANFVLPPEALIGPLTPADARAQVDAEWQKVLNARANARWATGAATGLNSVGGWAADAALAKPYSTGPLSWQMPEFKMPDVPGMPNAGGGAGGGGGAGKGAKEKSAIQEAADQVKNISDAIKSGVEAFYKLVGFKLPASFQTGVDNFAKAMNTVMMKLQAVALGFKDKGLEHLGLFNDTAAKGMDLVSKGVDALSKLNDFKAPTQAAIESFLNLVSDVTIRLGVAAMRWSVDALNQLSLFADASMKGMDLVAKGVDALTKLNDFVKPTDAAMQAFVDALDYITDLLRRVISKWEVDALAMATQFAESVGALMDALGKGIDVLSMLANPEWRKPADEAMSGFVDAFDYISDQLRRVIAKWDKVANETATAFGAAVGTLVDGLGKAMSLMNGLAAEEWRKPTDLAMNSFVDAIDWLSDKMRPVFAKWEKVALKAATEFGAGASALFGGISGGLDLLLKMADYKGTPYSVMVDLLVGLDDLLYLLGGFLPRWKSVATKAGAEIAGFLSTIADGVGKGLDLMLGLTKYKGVSYEALVDFLTGLDNFMALLDGFLPRWKGVATKVSSELAGYVGSMVGSIGAAIEPLVKLVDFKRPAIEAIDSFFAALGDFISAFAARSGAWKDQITDEVAKLAANIGVVVDSVGKAVDPLITMLNWKPIDPKSIESFASSVWELLNQFQIVMKGLPADFAANAEVWGSAVAKVAGAMKDALALLTDMGKGGEKGNSQSLAAIFKGLFDGKDENSLLSIWTKGWGDMLTNWITWWAKLKYEQLAPFVSYMEKLFTENIANWVGTWGTQWDAAAKAVEDAVRRMLLALGQLPAGILPTGGGGGSSGGGGGGAPNGAPRGQGRATGLGGAIPVAVGGGTTTNIYLDGQLLERVVSDRMGRSKRLAAQGAA